MNRRRIYVLSTFTQRAAQTGANVSMPSIMAWEGRQLEKPSTFIGCDGHKDEIAVALAETAKQREVRIYGKIGKIGLMVASESDGFVMRSRHVADGCNGIRTRWKTGVRVGWWFSGPARNCSAS